VIPQFSESTADAKLATLDTNLAEMRARWSSTITHNSTYPGAKKETDAPRWPPGGGGGRVQRQLTRFTAVTGVSSVSKDATYKYGPYVRRAAANRSTTSAR